jgi:hypothetical protein
MKKLTILVLQALIQLQKKNRNLAEYDISEKEKLYTNTKKKS